MGRHSPQAWAWEGRRGVLWEGRAWEAGGKGVPLDGAPETQVWKGEMQTQEGAMLSLTHVSIRHSLQ